MQCLQVLGSIFTIKCMKIMKLGFVLINKTLAFDIVYNIAWHSTSKSQGLLNITENTKDKNEEIIYCNIIDGSCSHLFTVWLRI